MIKALVLPADVQDRDAARLLLTLGRWSRPRLSHVWADGSYRGELIDRVRSGLALTLEVVKKPEEQKGFAVLPRRWVVERTFAWLGKWRRLSKDYEVRPQTALSFIHIAMTSLMLKRLAGI